MWPIYLQLVSIAVVLGITTAGWPEDRYYGRNSFYGDMPFIEPDGPFDAFIGNSYGGGRVVYDDTPSAYFRQIPVRGGSSEEKSNKKIKKKELQEDLEKTKRELLSLQKELATLRTVQKDVEDLKRWKVLATSQMNIAVRNAEEASSTNRKVQQSLNNIGRDATQAVRVSTNAQEIASDAQSSVSEAKKIFTNVQTSLSDIQTRADEAYELGQDFQKHLADLLATSTTVEKLSDQMKNIEEQTTKLDSFTEQWENVLPEMRFDLNETMAWVDRRDEQCDCVQMRRYG